MLKNVGPLIRPSPAVPLTNLCHGLNNKSQKLELDFFSSRLKRSCTTNEARIEVLLNDLMFQTTMKISNLTWIILRKQQIFHMKMSFQRIDSGETNISLYFHVLTEQC